MEIWVPIGIGILINAVIVGVAFGKMSQAIKDLTRRMGIEEGHREDNNIKREKWETKMEGTKHSMIPECVTEFKKINKNLNNLAGQVTTLLGLIKKE